MSLQTKIKVEKAFASWLPGVLNIAGLNSYPGHDKAEKAVMPWLIIYAENSSPHPDMPTEVGVRIVRLRFELRADSMVTTRANLDAWAGALELAMTDDLPALQAALNKPVGTDNRAVKKIHFHYVTPADDPSDRQETDFVENLVFDVTCELLDA